MAQNVWKDTLRTTVNLKKFKLSSKVVEAGYGKVIMFFNQKDYLKTTVAADTIKVTPKYFDNNAIANLLIKGKVKIIRRSDNIVESSITHYLKQVVTMCDREFELSNGQTFFSRLEIIGLMDVYTLPSLESIAAHKKDTIIQVKKFDCPEEFANTEDKTKIKIKDYFPVRPGLHYAYDLNNDYGELDTTICKQTIIEGTNVFYFAEYYNKYNIVSIGTTMFGPGLYFYKNDSLFTIKADYEKDIAEKKMEESKLLLPAYIAPGDSIVLNVDDFGTEKKSLVYLGKQQLQIGNHLYPDCIKIKVLEIWPETIYLSYIWLQKNIGLVQWVRTTKRGKELINIY